MNELIVVLAAGIAVAAAVRSTWSPCGLSMLSTLTPLAERSRGHRYGVTAAWFVVGSTAGGATLGVVVAVMALGVHRLGLSTEAALGAAAVCAVLAATSDLHPFGLQIPFHRRQVNELWLGRYRAWIYASGFGWQIGAGVVTYIMTAATYLLIALAALTASPLAAMAVAVLFGLVRGLAVLLSARITSPAALHDFHRRFDALGPKVRLAVIATELLAGSIAAGAAWGVAAGIAIAVAGGSAVVLATSSHNRRVRDHPASASHERPTLTV